MSLNIKNEETVRLVRELADALHVSMTAAITDAVGARLTQLREEPKLAFDVEQALAEWGELGDRLGHDYLRQDWDSILYDERGLPK